MRSTAAMRFLTLHPMQELWNERFRNGARPYGTEPSHFLKEKLDLIRQGGDVLLPGDGGGRNGVWMARHGFHAHILDYSREGILAAKKWAEESGCEVHLEQADVTTWRWPVARFDAVVAVYLHLAESVRTQVHQAMLNALKPDGLLLIEAFHVDQIAFQSGGPRDPTMLLTAEKIRADLKNAQILELRRDEVTLDESDLHRGPAVLMRLAARAVRRDFA